MTEHRVSWIIDIEAENAEEAARKALAIQRDAQSIATVFDVDGEQIDLTALDDESNASKTIAEQLHDAGRIGPLSSTVTPDE